MAIRLRIRDDGGDERSIDIDGDLVVIGRNPDNHVVLDDQRSSRRHCQIRSTPQGVLIEDLGSANGTQLNGAAIQRGFIKAGDEIRIGSTSLIMESVGAANVAGADDGSAAAETDAGATVVDGDPYGRLDSIEGDLKGQSFPLIGERCTLGRGDGCDIRLHDARVSTEHAEIVREPNRVVVRDLGSTNGIVVNGKRCRKAVLVTGATLAVGAFEFAVVVDGSTPLVRRPRSGSSGRVSDADVAEAAELALAPVDVDGLLGRGGLPQPVIAAALVVIAGCLCYFSIDFAQRLLVRRNVDPAADGNLIARNWSFEIEPADEAPGVPGWFASNAEASVTEEDAQFPGRHSLRVRATDPQVLGTVTAQIDGDDTRFVLSVDRRYRCEGFVANRGAFVATILIEWLRGGADGHLDVIGRSFTESPQSPLETVDALRDVIAPAGASHARISCATFGGAGSAIFDRISIRSLANERVDDTTAPSRNPERLSFDASDGKGALRIDLADDGTATLTNGSAVSLIDRIWAGLAVERDPLLVGPRLAPVIERRGDSGSVQLDTRVPDAIDGIWRAVEFTARSTTGSVTLAFDRPAAPAGESAPLVVYLEHGDSRLPVLVHGDSSRSMRFDAVEETVCNEVVVGRREARASVVFVPPVTIRSRKHPTIPSSNLLELRPPAASGVEMTFVPGSRSERHAALAILREATRLHQEGDALRARAELSRLPDLYPEQEREIAQAKELLARWNDEARRIAGGLEVDFSSLKANPNAVVFESFRSRIRTWLERLGGTSEGEVLKDLLSDVEAFWQLRQADRLKSAADALLASAREHFSNERYGLCELDLRSVLMSEPPEELAAEARRMLESIAGRREVEVSRLMNR